MQTKHCKNPEVCNEKHDRWKVNQSKFVPIGEREHETYLKHVEKGDYSATKSFHAKQREFFRLIDEQDIADVTNYGWVIERSYDRHLDVARLVIMGYTARRKPVHLVYEIEDENSWKLITVYTPLSDQHKWNNSFTERTCFCK